uniref:Interleukin-1 receptor type 2 n=1 Tax=Pogona vitticeps TaxID=103695 RepID=A0A6J0VCW8_9SAUR
MRRYKFQWVIPHSSLSCFLWNTVPRLLYIISTHTLDTSAFRIQRVESAADCQDHIVRFIPTFAVAGEPVVLKCPPFRYGHTDPLDLSLNFTWYKNGSTTPIPSEKVGNRIWSQGDALWFLPAFLDDSGEYICSQRNSSDCTDVSLHLIIVEKSAALSISYPQKAFVQSSGHVVCPALENFVQKDTGYKLRWYKDSTLLNTDNEKFVALTGTNYLIINSVSLDDSGYYTCQLTFDHETGQYNITRTIQLKTLVGQKKKSRPVIVSPNQKIVPAVLGSRLTIPCKVFVGASDRTYADVWWLANQTHVQSVYKKGRVTEGEPQKLIENNDNYIEVPLIFDPVKEVDFNTDFTCVAWNSLGHQVQATQVKPEERPLSWHLAVTPLALAAVIVGAVYIYKCWKNRQLRPKQQNILYSIAAH